MIWMSRVTCCGQGYREVGSDSKRWVPTSADLPGLEGTPAEHLQYDDPDGCQRRDFRCATIAHYSLFDAIHRAKLKASPFALNRLHLMLLGCTSVVSTAALHLHLRSCSNPWQCAVDRSADDETIVLATRPTTSRCGTSTPTAARSRSTRSGICTWCSSRDATWRVSSWS